MKARRDPRAVTETTYRDGIGRERCNVCLKLWPCFGQHEVVMYDVKCGELAILFLSDEAASIATDRDAIARVAQAIQDAAEAACEDERRRAVAAMDAKGGSRG
jgi:hypothetical protein